MTLIKITILMIVFLTKILNDILRSLLLDSGLSTVTASLIVSV